MRGAGRSPVAGVSRRSEHSGRVGRPGCWQAGGRTPSVGHGGAPDTLGRADRRAVGRACRNTLRRTGVGAGCLQVGRAGMLSGVPPERSREPPASRLQPVPLSSSCPGTPNERRRGQPLHRPAATETSPAVGSAGSAGVPANTGGLVHPSSATLAPRADSRQRARWRTPPPRRAGSPLAPRSSPRREPDRQTVADPCTQSRPLARAVGQRPDRHRPRSPR